MKLIENIDYYLIEKKGIKYRVFTEKYHLERGYCCGNKCLHCPFDEINFGNKNKKVNFTKQKE